MWEFFSEADLQHRSPPLRRCDAFVLTIDTKEYGTGQNSILIWNSQRMHNKEILTWWDFIGWDCQLSGFWKNKNKKCGGSCFSSRIFNCQTLSPLVIDFKVVEHFAYQSHGKCHVSRRIWLDYLIEDIVSFCDGMRNVIVL